MMSQSSNCRLNSVGPFSLFKCLSCKKRSVVGEAFALSHDAERLKVSLCEIGFQYNLLNLLNTS